MISNDGEESTSQKEEQNEEAPRTEAQVPASGSAVPEEILQRAVQSVMRNERLDGTTPQGFVPTRNKLESIIDSIHTMEISGASVEARSIQKKVRRMSGIFIKNQEPFFGSIIKREKEPSFCRTREVVLSQ